MVKYSKFKQWMVANNVKQKDIALLLNITDAFCSVKMNSPTNNFTIEQLSIICNKYNISFDEFFLKN